MSEKASRGIVNVIYAVLITLGLFMHMSISGMEVGSLIIGIFTELSGIVTFLSKVFSWLIAFIFRSHTIFMAGTILILWFVVLPMLVRYRIILIRPTLMLSIVVTLYLFLGLKMFGFVAL